MKPFTVKFTAAIAALSLASALFTGCAQKPAEPHITPSPTEISSLQPTEAPDETKEPVISETPKAPETPEVTKEPEASETPEITKEPETGNTLILNFPEIPGSENFSSQTNEDGTYCRVDIVPTFFYDADIPGTSVSRNIALALSAENGESAADLITRAILSLESGSREISVKQADGFIESMGLPCFRISWLEGGNEDTRIADGVAVAAENYLYLYYFTTPADFYDDAAGTVEAFLAEAALEPVE